MYLTELMSVILEETAVELILDLGSGLTVSGIASPEHIKKCDKLKFAKAMRVYAGDGGRIVVEVET